MLRKMLTWSEALIRHASGLTYIREYAGANRGEGVEAMQSATGNHPPDYWCMSFVYRCVRKMLGKVLLRSASCSEQRAYAKKNGALRTRAEFDDVVRTKGPDAVRGWVFLVIDTTAEPRPEEKALGLKGHAHHTGLCGAARDTDDAIIVVPKTADGFVTTEGNAADPEKLASRDGNGAYKGRLRGNVHATTFTFENTARDYKPDLATYEFVDLEVLP